MDRKSISVNITAHLKYIKLILINFIFIPSYNGPVTHEI
ncbi:hypothetical protein A464_265 [Salmonella bongori N268-08]|uniref:Uncharacterized protein n=1 Tax=Salmonella bongori N268-08 TaxID=1197719 RepID=S5MLL8_SALBN|nr:hypothetical protein A464_265 [Salmonella bongori N268-08]